MKIIFFLILASTGITQLLEGQSNRYIAFCAKEGIPGHAFVVFGREDSIQQMTVFDGSWGFYPKSSKKGGKSFIIGEVPGEIRDDFLTNNDVTFILVVSETEYNQALKIKEKWAKNASYSLAKNDCVTFLTEVANVVKDRITIPERAGFANFPAKFLAQLVEENNNQE